MGVTKLGDLFADRQTVSFDQFSDKSIAFDGNNILYQFLTRIRQSDGSLLTDEYGNVTSHLSGLLYRVTRIIESGIKIVFIFDGKPPEEKAKEILKRKTKKKEADVAYQEALDRGDMVLAQRYAQRTARLTSPMIKDASRLLDLMGVPVVHALSEGEGQAAYMAKNGDVYASCSQDYDSLLFGTPRLLRNLTVSGKRKLPGKNIYVEVKPELIDLEHSLKVIDLTHDQIIDIAILLGTDFNPNGIGVSGIGPKTALKLIKEHENFENILKLPKMSEAKIDFDIDNIRKIFKEPIVTKEYNLNWSDPNVDGMIEFLSEERGFSEARVRTAVAKVLKKSEDKKK